MTVDLDEAMQRAEAGQLLTRRHGEALANAVKSSRARVRELTAELVGVREELEGLQKAVAVVALCAPSSRCTTNQEGE